MKLKDIKFKGKARFVRRTIAGKPSVVDKRRGIFAPFVDLGSRDRLLGRELKLASTYSWLKLP